MEDTFVNNRKIENFEKENENYNIKKTVYNNISNNIYIKENDYTNYLLRIEITPEILEEELKETNPNIVTAKTILSHKIAEDLDLLKFTVENKLLNEFDILFVFLGLISCFNEELNVEILDYLYDNIKFIKKNDKIPKLILNLLKNDEINCFNLLDWLYNKNKEDFANIIGNLIHGDKKETFLEYIKKYEDIYEIDDCVILRSMCISYDLDTIKSYLEKVNDDKIQYKKMCDYSLNNKNDDVFLYFNEKCEYKCENIYLIFNCVAREKIKIANVLVKNLAQEIDSEKIIETISKINSTNVVEFIVDNYELLKIDIHVKNDLLLRNYIMDENYDVVKYLYENENKIGIFGNSDINMKIKKILKFVENQELKNYVNDKISRIL
jgi:hypothetical protein